MINAFESTVRICPERTCFVYVDESGAQQTYSYQETRLIAASLARYLRDSGAVGRGESVVIDLPNCPAYIMFLLAAGYGGFSLVLLNHRLTASEKESRVQELERMPSETLSLVVDESNADALVKEAVEAQLGEDLAEALRERTSGRAAHASYVSPDGIDPLDVGTDKALGRAQTGRESRRRRRELARQDVVGSLVHYAEQAASVYDRNSRAAVMFTSGSTGRPKAAPLLWRNLCASAEASNLVLNQPEEGLWQAVLPLYHVGGLEVVIRSILNRNTFILYRRFDADLLITDVRRMRATHVSVVDKMLQDMIGTGRAADLRGYECILLGGGPLNPATIDRVKALGLNVYASYGMTETCSQIANALVTPKFYGGMELLPGCQARVVDPDKDGYGRLAVRAPSVIDGYLNARTTRTADGYFLTGDTGAMLGGKLYVKERTDDMFVSGGEKIYPAEIREKILHVPGVSDAYVFGVRDEKWGRRPVAFVERDRRAGTQAAAGDSPGLAAAGDGAAGGIAGVSGAEAAADDPANETALAAAKLSDRDFAASVRKSLGLTLSKINMPQRIFVVDELPRMGIGKTDRSTIERMYDERIEVAHVMLYRIRLPFNKPFKTPKGTLRNRESVLVEVTDYAGRTGLGECVAFSTDWYLPETLEDDMEVLRDELAPAVTHEVFLHPREASRLFKELPRAKEHPMACAAIETALWDLYGKIVGKPLWQLIDDEFERMGGGRRRGGFGRKVGAHARMDSREGGQGAAGEIAVPAGAVIGLGSASEAASAARDCANRGYMRIKLKVEPGGSTLSRVRAVQEAAPQAMLTLDANQSFSERNMDELRELDKCGAAWIEEPLDLSRPHGRWGASSAPADPFDRLAKLQQELNTPICLDESITTPDDLKRALLHPELRCYVVKIGKLGGVEPALEFLREARRRGLTVWMGGMYDTGISKRLHAAFQTLPGIDAPGDIGATSRYFSCDVTEPPYEVKDGKVTLNGSGHEAGLGCELNREALSKVLVAKFRC